MQREYLNELIKLYKHYKEDAFIIEINDYSRYLRENDFICCVENDQTLKKVCLSKKAVVLCQNEIKKRKKDFLNSLRSWISLLISIIAIVISILSYCNNTQRTTDKTSEKSETVSTISDGIS